LRMCKNGIKIYFLRVNWIWSGDQSKDKMSKDIHVELERLVYFASSNIHFLKYVIFFHIYFDRLNSYIPSWFRVWSAIIRFLNLP
jgi:hypothetical protein